MTAPDMAQYLEIQQIRVAEVQAILKFIFVACGSEDSRMVELARSAAETGHDLARAINEALDAVNLERVGAA